MNPHRTQLNPAAGSLVSFDSWLRSLDKTRTTGWRWREEGRISTINIFGKLYLTRNEIEKFERRALAGEFHKQPKTPARAA